MDRRNLIKLAPLGLLVGCSTNSKRLSSTEISGCEIFNDFIGPEEQEDIAFLGEENSRHDEVRKAFRLLWEAPRTSDHMAVARYFENIKAVNYNEKDSAGNYPLYNEEWVTVSNPLITSFFGMTNTLPTKGDVVPWCAAFVSFILYAAGKPTKFSAASKAYRTYNEPTENPEYGDLVVFENKKNSNRGHVGFFVSKDDQGVKVLGGNQRGASGSTGAITTSLYEYETDNLKLHSFRSMKTI